MLYMIPGAFLCILDEIDHLCTNEFITFIHIITFFAIIPRSTECVRPHIELTGNECGVYWSTFQGIFLKLLTPPKPPTCQWAPTSFFVTANGCGWRTSLFIPTHFILPYL